MLAVTMAIGFCPRVTSAAEPLQPIPETGPIPANGTVYSQGGCPGGDCGDGHHHHAGWHDHHHYSPLSHALHYPYGRMHSPDTGWGRPMKYPVDRTPITYLRYWPQTWYGQPRPDGPVPTFPMVYTPTDTTQLGYYYQRVPQWQPNPAMVPPMPWPSQWNRRESSHTHYPPHWQRYTYQGCLERHQPYQGAQPQYITPTPVGAAAGAGETNEPAPEPPAMDGNTAATPIPQRAAY